MIGIKAISSYVPARAIDNFAQAKAFGESDDFVAKKIGAARLPRKEDEQETSDLAALAVDSLGNKSPELHKAEIDALVVVTQHPDGEGLPHTAAILQHKLALPTKVAAFDVSLGCSGYVYGLFLLKGFLEASGLANGILVTSDPYSKTIDENDRVTSMLFGDAATATWIGRDPIWTLDAVAYGTDGSGSEYLKVNKGRLYMNGRQIFNFAATQVHPHITQLLTRENLSPEDVDVFCVHQGSAAIVDAIARRFGSLSTRFMKDITNTGNTVSSSIPLLLEKISVQRDAKRVVICGFGVGLSMASAVISKGLKREGND